MVYRFGRICSGVCWLALYCCRQPQENHSTATTPPPQAPIITARRPPLQLAFDQFTIEDGLCGNDISDLYQDDLGYLWISTDGGLNRYDGYAFKAYRHEPGVAGSLPANEIFRVRGDSHGNIWVLTAKGLSLLKPDGGFQTWYDSLLNDINANLTRMVIDRKDRIWLRGDHSLLYFEPATGQFVQALPYSALPVFREADGTLFTLVARQQASAVIH